MSPPGKRSILENTTNQLVLAEPLHLSAPLVQSARPRPVEVRTNVRKLLRSSGALETVRTCSPLILLVSCCTGSPYKGLRTLDYSRGVGPPGYWRARPNNRKPAAGRGVEMANRHQRRRARVVEVKAMTQAEFAAIRARCAAGGLHRALRRRHARRAGPI